MPHGLSCIMDKEVNHQGFFVTRIEIEESTKEPLFHDSFCGTLELMEKSHTTITTLGDLNVHFFFSGMGQVQVT